MSAQPASDLPGFTIEQASAYRMVTVADAARVYRIDPSTIEQWLAREGHEPVGVLLSNRSRPRLLYLADRVQAAVALHRGRRSTVSGARPRLVGTKTPTAGRPYQWRDPARWRGNTP